MPEEEIVKIESDIEREESQKAACYFCEQMGTPRGNQLLLLVWVLIPILLFLMVIVTLV